MATAAVLGTECSRCKVAIRRSAYELRARGASLFRCLRCSLMHPALVRQSLVIALIVGTVLTAINQADVLFSGGQVPASLYWKIPLTYCVPYCVATTGAVLNARRAVDDSIGATP